MSTTVMPSPPYASRVNAETLVLLAERATPGPWDAFGSHVSSIALEPDPAAGEWGRDSQGSHDYYSGALVAESCDRADALLIAAMRNALPEIAAAHVRALERIERLQLELRLQRAELADLDAFIELIRSERYERPRFAVQRQLSIQRSMNS